MRPYREQKPAVSHNFSRLEKPEELEKLEKPEELEKLEKPEELEKLEKPELWIATKCL